MIIPSGDEVKRAADMLARLAANGNPRPGDGWLSQERLARQFQVRALDMLTIMKNAPAIMDDAGLPLAPPAPSARWPIVLAFGLSILAVVVAFAWGYACGIVLGMGIA